MNDDRDIRTAFDNLRRDAATRVSAGESLDRLKRRNTWWRRAAVPAFAAAVVVLVAVGAFALIPLGEDAPPVATEPGPAPTVAPTVVDTTPVTTPDPTDTTIVVGTAPPPPAGLPAFSAGDVLVAGDESLYSWDGTEATLLLDAKGLVVDDDFAGGIIYTHPDAIWWIPYGSYESQFLLAGRVDLHGVALIDGTTTVMYTESSESDTPVTRLHLLTIQVEPEAPTVVTEDRVVWEMGPMEGGVSRVSYGGGILAITVQTDGGVYFDFVDPAGNPVDVPGPQSEFGEMFLWADQGLLSPDGSVLVYLEADDAPVDLVAWDTAAGVELARHPLDPEDQAWPGRIRADFDGRTIVVAQQLATWTDPLSFTYADGAFTPGPAVGINGAPSLVTAVEPVEPPPPATECTVGDFTDEPYGDLPDPVAVARADVIDAARACDYDALEEIALASGEFFYFFDQYRQGDFASGDGDEILEVILDLVNQPFGTLEAGEPYGTLYIWPRAATYATWDDVTDEDLDYLRRMGYDETEFAAYADFGGYVGWRTAITADGEWLNITAGD